MPNFNYGPNYLAGYQSVFQPITAFQQGRANKLAYETELQQQDVRAQELAGLEYANRPDVRAAAAEHQAATTDYMKAQTEVMRRPAPYEPPDYIKGASTGGLTVLLLLENLQRA